MMVGRGMGPTALAAVNLVSPLFTISTGIGLMFGVGGSVLASTSLGQKNTKRAKMYTGHSLLLALIVAVVSIAVIMIFPKQVALMFSTPDSLMDGVIEYLQPIALAMLFNVMLTVGLFFIRLDGSPKFAMTCVGIGVLFNIVLDYLFIFEFKWGLFGAAFATMISQVISCILMAVYIFRFSKVIRPKFFKIKRKQLSLLLENSRNIVLIGFPAFLGDIALSLMVIVGNITFIRYVGDDGVAAFSIICFIFPIVFMAYNAVIHSAQPIISHNIRTNITRSKQALMLSGGTAFVLGLVFTAGIWMYCNEIVSLFLSSSTHAYEIAVNGIKWFGLGFVFYGLNILYVGYLQSIGRENMATMFVVLRGGLLTILTFVLMPMWLGEVGIWLAVPVAELIALLLIGVYELKSLSHSV